MIIKITPKNRLFIVLILLFAIFLSGCNGKNNTANVDFDAFTRDITGGGVFSVEIIPIDLDQTLMRYFLSGDDIAEFSAGISAQVKNKAEEFAIFKAVDDTAAKRVKAAVEELIVLQKVSYGAYGPLEVPKLDNAIVKLSGVYVLYVCANDYAAAEKIISDYLK